MPARKALNTTGAHSETIRARVLQGMWGPELQLRPNLSKHTLVVYCSHEYISFEYSACLWIMQLRIANWCNHDYCTNCTSTLQYQQLCACATSCTTTLDPSRFLWFSMTLVNLWNNLRNYRLHRLLIANSCATTIGAQDHIRSDTCIHVVYLKILSKPNLKS